MKESEVTAVSDDNLKMRAKVQPLRWPIEGAPLTFSNLNVDVPEFVPGQSFVLPPTAKDDDSQMKGNDS